MNRILFPAPTLAPFPPLHPGSSTSVPFNSFDLLFNPRSLPLFILTILFTASPASTPPSPPAPNNPTISLIVSPSLAVTYIAPSPYPVADPADTALAGKIRHYVSDSGTLQYNVGLTLSFFKSTINYPNPAKSNEL